MSPPLVDLAGVVKDYRGLRPLRLERFTLEAGRQVALVGFDEPAAEILTTLITGAALPDRGTIRVLDTDTAAIEDSTAWLALVDRIGIVSDRAALLDSFSVIQNLSIPFTLEIDPPPDDIGRRAALLASELGLAPETWHRPAGELDATARVRIRVARALSFDPAMLLFEHPTARVARPEVKPLAAALHAVIERRGLATLTITADDEFASAFANEVFTWEPASGKLTPRRSGGWLRRRR